MGVRGSHRIVFTLLTFSVLTVTDSIINGIVKVFPELLIIGVYLLCVMDIFITFPMVGKLLKHRKNDVA